MRGWRFKLFTLQSRRAHILYGTPFDGESLRIPSRLSHSTRLSLHIVQLRPSSLRTLSNISFLFVCLTLEYI